MSEQPARNLCATLNVFAQVMNDCSRAVVDWCEQNRETLTAVGHAIVALQEIARNDALCEQWLLRLYGPSAQLHIIHDRREKEGIANATGYDAANGVSSRPSAIGFGQLAIPPYATAD